MEERGYWDQEKEKEYQTAARKKVLSCLGKAEKVLRPDIEHLFTDVYDTLPQNLVEQRESLKKHLDKYGYHYPLDKYTDGAKWGK
jgi:2-oxoisovalerate dehydrogenase E1 component alpha subunit